MCCECERQSYCFAALCREAARAQKAEESRQRRVYRARLLREQHAAMTAHQAELEADRTLGIRSALSYTLQPGVRKILLVWFLSSQKKGTALTREWPSAQGQCCLIWYLHSVHCLYVVVYWPSGHCVVSSAIWHLTSSIQQCSACGTGQCCCCCCCCY